MGKKTHPKWILCAALVVLGLIALFLLQGYDFSGLFFLGLAVLIPIYHILGLWKRKHPKLGRWAIVLLNIFLCLLLAAMILTLGIIIRDSKGTESPDCEYLVVLGAGVNGTKPSRSLRERLDAAFDYLSQHPDAVAIVSGGQGSGEDISEAQCMYDYLTQSGISPKRVWMEDQATSTLENLQYSLDLIEFKTGVRPTGLAIVSSEYHLHRAGMFAHWLEIEAQLVPAKTAVFPLRWNYFLREIFAIWYYSLFGG